VAQAPRPARFELLDPAPVLVPRRTGHTALSPARRLGRCNSASRRRTAPSITIQYVNITY
jgi:hypothetical protein